MVIRHMQNILLVVCLFFFLYILHKPLFVFINGFNVNLGLCTDILVLWCLDFLFLNLSMMVTFNHVLWLWLLFGSLKWSVKLWYGNNRVGLAGLDIFEGMWTRIWNISSFYVNFGLLIVPLTLELEQLFTEIWFP